jgi:DNA-binding XRE family transcriptional regulator
MKPQVIKKNGKPEYAVIPYDEYRRLVEDAEMLADVRDFDTARKALVAGDEELIPAEVVDRLLDGGNPVRVWREYRGLSAADLAKACSVTAAAISQIESGKRKSSVILLKKIARILKVDLDTLTVTEDDSKAAQDPTKH